MQSDDHDDEMLKATFEAKQIFKLRRLRALVKQGFDDIYAGRFETITADDLPRFMASVRGHSRPSQGTPRQVED